MINIAVIGLGKIGLPLAVQFAGKGHKVVGVDINELTVSKVNAKKEPFPGEKNLETLLAKVVDQGNLTATTDSVWAVQQSEVVVVVVPLFVNNSGIPDFTSMDSATENIAKGLKPGTLISYETTLPVGTTRNRFTPIIEKISGLSVTKDFNVVFSPERVFTGRVFEDLRKYPKLVGGIDAESTKAGIEFYEAVLDFDNRTDLSRPNGVWDLGTSEAAELAKLAETTYRDVNIALANQFALFAEKNSIDIHKVIEASNSQPYSHIHKPGIAVGGHCIPIYPRMYLWNDPEATVVQTAREANEAMPDRVVNVLISIHGEIKGQKVAVLGASYRGGVKETAFSGVFPTVKALEKYGAMVFVQDPMFTDSELQDLGFAPYHFKEEIDIAIVQADHESYRSLNLNYLPGLKTLIDGRGITDPTKFNNVTYHVLGNPIDAKSR